MKCLTHPDRDAVGMCSICYRGVCRDCALETHDRLYCKNCASSAISRMAKGERLDVAQPPQMPPPAPAQQARKKEEPEIDWPPKTAGGQPPSAPEQKPQQTQKTPQLPSMLKAGEKKEFAPRQTLAGPKVPPLPSVFKPVPEAGTAMPAPPARYVGRMGGTLPLLEESLPEMLTPAAAGGVVMGVIMGIPLLNLCIFAWPVGGALAFFMLRASSPVKGRLTEKDMLRLGALAGVFAAVVSLFVGFIINAFFADVIIGGTFSALGSGLTMNVLNFVGVDDNLDLYFILLTVIGRLIVFPLIGAAGAVLALRYTQKQVQI